MTLPDFLTQDATGAIRLAGHRLGLEHLLRRYRQGYSPEMIWCDYPALSLALIHKVIAFYLENQAEADAYLEQTGAAVQANRAAAKPAPGLEELRRRLRQRPSARGA